ncbi:hypothetical protein IC575_016531 [Cucumis melo]
MWYFSPIPRFERMFRSKETSKLLMWHGRKREVNDLLQHPKDALSWTKIDNLWPEFGSEPRNLRLALSTDGVNPHGDLSERYSCWPVMLVTYNLPPWLCMKRKFLMLTALISGPKQPGNEIDVYLAPLVDDLKILWHDGVECYDAYQDQCFRLKAILLWTINDFPAYDVMHIEKNVCANLIGTLLDIPGKTKDGVKSRLDLVELNIRSELAPQVGEKKIFLPPACYTLSRAEKLSFCKTLSELKVPEGYSSNIQSLPLLRCKSLVLRTKNPVMSDMTFYGVIREIWEIDYHQLSFILFKCDWVDNRSGVKVDELGFTIVDLKRIGHKSDSFILATQAKQVFYVQDSANPEWSVVLTSPQRTIEEDFFEDEIGDMLQECGYETIKRMPNVDTPNETDDTNSTYIRHDCEGRWVEKDS